MDPLYQDIQEQLVSEEDFPDSLTTSSLEVSSHDHSLPHCQPHHRCFSRSFLHANRNTSSASSHFSPSPPSWWQLSYYFPTLEERALDHCFSHLPPLSYSSSSSLFPSLTDLGIHDANASEITKRNGSTNLKTSPLPYTGEPEIKEEVGAGEDRVFRPPLAFLERGLMGRVRVAIGCQLLRYTSVTCRMERTEEITTTTRSAATRSPPSTTPASPSPLSSVSSSSQLSTAFSERQSFHNSTDLCGCNENEPEGEEEGDRHGTQETPTPPYTWEGDTTCVVEVPNHPTPAGSASDGLPALVDHHTQDCHSYVMSGRGVDVNKEEGKEETGVRALHTNTRTPSPPPRTGREFLEEHEGVDKMERDPILSTTTGSSSVVSSSMAMQCTESLLLVGGTEPEALYWVDSYPLPMRQEERGGEAWNGLPMKQQWRPFSSSNASSSTSCFFSLHGTPTEDGVRSHRREHSTFLLQLWDSIHHFWTRSYLSIAHFLLRPYTPYVSWEGNEVTHWTHTTLSMDGAGEPSFISSHTNSALHDEEDLLGAHQFCQYFYWKSPSWRASTLVQRNDSSNDSTMYQKGTRAENKTTIKGEGGWKSLSESFFHPFSSAFSSIAFISNATFRIMSSQSVRDGEVEEIGRPIENGSTVTITRSTTRSTSTWWWGFPFRFLLDDEVERIHAASPGLLVHLFVLFPSYLIIGVPYFFLSEAKQLLLSFIGTPSPDSLVGTLSVNGTQRLECCLLLVTLCLLLLLLLVFAHLRYKKYTRALQQAMKKGKKKREQKRRE